MTGRRDVLIGAACLAGGGLAYALVPRRHVVLLKRGRTVEKIVPRTFGEWNSRDVSDLVAPKAEDSLASKLYGETVGRIYQRIQGGPEIMMLLAYGDTQSDDLQLHRPEVCYPAFGFEITQSASLQLHLRNSVSIPVRLLVADAPDRRETIIYWSRLGEFLPLSQKKQALDRLRTSMSGKIADGLLARFSVFGPDPDAGVAVLMAFIPALIEAVAADSRDVLIGTQRSVALTEAGL